MFHKKWLDVTIEMAIHNVKSGGGPFGAIVVKDGKVIGSGTNQVHLKHDPSAHAELLAIREACATLESIDLSNCILYASGEPCPMCLGAAYWATVGEIYYACSKKEAFDGTGFRNPLSNFFSDQEKASSLRSVPFIHMKTDNSLTPFVEWQHINYSAN